MGKGIMVIGAAILDVLARPVSMQVFEKGSHPVEELRLEVGGDAANEALVLAGLGKNVWLQTVLGNDMAGRMVLESLRESGIKISDNCVREDIRTGINTVLVREGGERSFLTDPGGSLRKLGPEHLTFPFEKAIDILSFASIFVSPRFGAAEMEKLFCRAKEQGILVCADMTKPKNGEQEKDIAGALRWVDYFFPNREEACMLTREADEEKAAARLLNAGVKHVVIKCGGDGCLVGSGEDAAHRELFRVPAVPGVRCVDTTGAGDSFTAGFLAALSEGKNLRQCSEFACVCGAKAVECAGAARWVKM